MSDEKQVLKLAAERLLAVANGATMEESGGEGFGWRTVNISEISAAPFVRWITGHQCRIRPHAVAPEPKPSQAVLDACKRLGVEAWKLGRYKTGDHTLHPGAVHNDGEDGYARYKEFRVLHADHDQRADSTCRYWHVRPIATPSLPCPPRPTPEQVDAARMPDGRRVKEPTVCEVPNGRAWFTYDGLEVRGSDYSPCMTSDVGERRWIAEPADEVVEPWEMDHTHIGKTVCYRQGNKAGIIDAMRRSIGEFHVAQCGWFTPEKLVADWTHNGKPCGVAK